MFSFFRRGSNKDDKSQPASSATDKPKSPKQSPKNKTDKKSNKGDKKTSLQSQGQAESVTQKDTSTSLSSKDHLKSRNAPLEINDASNKPTTTNGKNSICQDSLLNGDHHSHEHLSCRTVAAAGELVTAIGRYESNLSLVAIAPEMVDDFLKECQDISSVCDQVVLDDTLIDCSQLVEQMLSCELSGEARRNSQPSELQQENLAAISSACQQRVKNNGIIREHDVNVLAETDALINIKSDKTANFHANNISQSDMQNKQDDTARLSRDCLEKSDSNQHKPGYNLSSSVHCQTSEPTIGISLIVLILSVN